MTTTTKKREPKMSHMPRTEPDVTFEEELAAETEQQLQIIQDAIREVRIATPHPKFLHRIQQQTEHAAALDRFADTLLEFANKLKAATAAHLSAARDVQAELE